MFQKRQNAFFMSDSLTFVLFCVTASLSLSLTKYEHREISRIPKNRVKREIYEVLNKLHVQVDF